MLGSAVIFALPMVLSSSDYVFGIFFEAFNFDAFLALFNLVFNSSRAPMLRVPSP